MDKKKALVVGGYGTVGSDVTKTLAADDRIHLIIAGRNKTKAAETIYKYGAEWRTIDICDEASVASALTGVTIVINCFSGPFTNAPLYLPESCAKRGIHYLDVSGSYEYAERFLTLHDLAAANNATLITALGANPGIPGVVLMNSQNEFDELESGKIYFIMGTILSGISISSLKELKYMLDVKPLVWNNGEWKIPANQSLQTFVGEPFNKKVYLGSSVTRDLLSLPALTGIKELSFFSGSQSMWQGLAMILGLKFGLTKTDRRAECLLNFLKRFGKSKDSVSDILLKIEIVGKKDGVRQKQIVELIGDENFVTAISPSLVCQQMVEDKITQRGAFVPPQVVPAKDFVEKLRKTSVKYSEVISSEK